MEEIKNLLEARVNYLNQIKKEKENELLDVPEGKLRICHHGDKTQYYKRSGPKDFNGTYISEKDRDMVKKLAQKEYDITILRTIEKELKAIQKFLSGYPENYIEKIYKNLRKERQKLIRPLKETDEQFLKEWNNKQYERKGFYADNPMFYTAKGECVRSKSEVIIADLLNREGIPYRYEYPVYIKGYGKIYPDFTVLNIRKREEIIWEHFGLMDDVEYAEKFVQKLSSYEKNGYLPGKNLICTFETRKNPINQQLVKRMIEQYIN